MKTKLLRLLEVFADFERTRNSLVRVPAYSANAIAGLYGLHPFCKAQVYNVSVLHSDKIAEIGKGIEMVRDLSKVQLTEQLFYLSKGNFELAMYLDPVIAKGNTGAKQLQTAALIIPGKTRRAIVIDLVFAQLVALDTGIADLFEGSTQL